MEEKRKPGRPKKTSTADQKKSTRKPVKNTDITTETEEKKKKLNRKPNSVTNFMKELSANYDNPRIKPGDNSRFVRHALASVGLPPIDISDPEQVQNRAYEYLKYCSDNDRRPQIVGLCNWLGITRTTLYDWVNNNLKERKKHCEVIRHIYSLMEEMWTEYMQYGKISPPTAIFLAKNWYGYRDEQNIVVTPNNPLQDLDNDQAAKRIMEAIPGADDDDF